MRIKIFRDNKFDLKLLKKNRKELENEFIDDLRKNQTGICVPVRKGQKTKSK